MVSTKLTHITKFNVQVREAFVYRTGIKNFIGNFDKQLKYCLYIFEKLLKKTNTKICGYVREPRVRC